MNHEGLYKFYFRTGYEERGLVDLFKLTLFLTALYLPWPSISISLLAACMSPCFVGYGSDFQYEILKMYYGVINQCHVSTLTITLFRISELILILSVLFPGKSKCLDIDSLQYFNKQSATYDSLHNTSSVKLELYQL
jgi:hypothetical protein